MEGGKRKRRKAEGRVHGEKKRKEGGKESNETETRQVKGVVGKEGEGRGRKGEGRGEKE